MDTLTYSKMMLEKVSFDEELLEKEFRKFSNQLPESEKTNLKKWCLKKFGHKFRNMLRNNIIKRSK